MNASTTTQITRTVDAAMVETMKKQVDAIRETWTQASPTDSHNIENFEMLATLVGRLQGEIEEAEQALEIEELRREVTVTEIASAKRR